MFGLFRKKTPPKTLFPDDQKKSDMANAIAELLGIQLLILPPEHKRIENDDGHIYRKAVGYIYGYIDAFPRMRGLDMSNIEIGPPIIFHVFRKLFPECDPLRYVEFLSANLRDETVNLGIMHGGQQCIDYSKPGVGGAPIGLSRFILEESALQEGRA
jgi:hypothetical protein